LKINSLKADVVTSLFVVVLVVETTALDPIHGLKTSISTAAASLRRANSTENKTKRKRLYF
jgi:hypothetical protein